MNRLYHVWLGARGYTFNDRHDARISVIDTTVQPEVEDDKPRIPFGFRPAPAEPAA